MKHTIYFFLILFGINTIPCKADNSSMSPILSDAIKIMDMVENEYEQEIVRMEFDIINDKKSTYRTLTNKYTYGIIAFGDYRVKDIDIKVYKWVNNDWRLIEKDVDTDCRAAVSITPSYTEQYKIEISVYQFEEGYSAAHYGLIIFHK